MSARSAITRPACLPQWALGLRQLRNPDPSTGAAPDHRQGHFNRRLVSFIQSARSNGHDPFAYLIEC